MHARKLLLSGGVDDANVGEVDPNGRVIRAAVGRAPARLELADRRGRKPSLELQHQPTVSTLFGDSEHESLAFVRRKSDLRAAITAQ